MCGHRGMHVIDGDAGVQREASQMAKAALEIGKNVCDIVLERNLLTKQNLDKLVNPENLIRPEKYQYDS